MLSCSFSLCCFFFSPSVDHRDLHSFPTRRSSDLTGPPTVRGAQRAPAATTAAATSSGWPRSGPARSEEHTSELQSLRQIVCRLLLEKKKSNTFLPQTAIFSTASITSFTIIRKLVR